MKSNASLIEPKPGLDRCNQVRFVLLGGQFEGLCGGLHGVGKLARFGIGRCQRVEHGWLLGCRESNSLLGQIDRLGAVAQRSVGISRQQPGRSVDERTIRRMRANPFTLLGHYLPVAFLARQGKIKIATRAVVLWLNFQCLPKMADRLIAFAAGGQRRARLLWAFAESGLISNAF